MWPLISLQMSGTASTLHRGLCTGKSCWRTTVTWSLRVFQCQNQT
ncbi:hypothetical protein U0070_020057 [Myodes glareolus]|uniref:Uncharacterized protein n=1 Tax=Myodes glareolus TaxID=447135 RepID=A0AAW0H806_MYOGA